MNFEDPVNPLNQLHRISLNSLNPDGATDRVVKSIRHGRIYETSLAILRAQAASGLDTLDDKCIKGMGAETLFDDNMTFIAAIALSRPTLDYEELLTYALSVKERLDIRRDLNKIIKKFGYQKSFYHFFIAQQSHDDAITRIFDVTGVIAPKLVAPHGDLAAMRRLSKLFREDIKTMSDKALSHFTNDRASAFREKLTGSPSMSNFEFTERMDIFFRQKAGLTKGLFDDETVEVYTLDQMLALPGFDQNVVVNADEIVKSFYRVLRCNGNLAEVDELEAIEQRIITPLLKGAGDRMAVFFAEGLGKSASWIRDVLDTQDGGRQQYLEMLIESAESNKVIENLTVRAFIRFEPASELLKLCKDEATKAKLYGMTANVDYLREASPKVRDLAMAHDLGL